MTQSRRPTDACQTTGTTLLPSFPPTKVHDVVGLGEAMIDFSAFVSDATLESFHVAKGGRRVIDIEERLEIQRRLGDDYVLQAGSSITNTLVALAQLSRAEGDPYRLGFAGCIGSDRLGDFYAAHLKNSGIQAYTCALDESMERLTGCVIVLTTPDAQRSFLVYPGEGTPRLTESVKEAIATSRVFVIEGYLFGLSEMATEIEEAVLLAKQHGVLVAVTGGDAEVVRKARDDFWSVIKMGVDIFLCNQSEAAALLSEDKSSCCAHKAIQRLAPHFSLVAVTDGSNGSYIAAMGQLQTVPPFWLKNSPVDTCGAGDVYAAGLLHGLLKGYDLCGIGLAASRSASAILSRHGAQLLKEDALQIIADIARDERDSVENGSLNLKLEEA